MSRIFKRSPSGPADSTGEQRREGVHYSFDIFDTLLTRLVAEPTALFLFLGARGGRKGLLPTTPEQFARARVSCEQRARLNSPYPEITLEEIYLEMQYALGLSDSIMSALLAEELALEEEFIRPVPTMRHRVAKARVEAGRVLFISEIYLPAAFLERMLRLHGFYADGDRLHVSSGHRAQKHDGRLYRAVLEAERIDPSILVHTGDNYHLDVEVPRLLGMRSVHFSDAVPNVYETQLNKLSFETGGVSSLLAGISRLTRLEIDESEADARAVSTTGACVAAPFLLLFTVWLLEEAKRVGLKKLYFTTRDGGVLLRIACAVAPHVGSGDIELRLLYGSREAWYPATVPILDEKGWDSLIELRSGDRTVASIFERLQLAPIDYAQELLAAGFAAECWNRPLDRAGMSSLKDLVLGNDAIATAAQEALKNRAEMILRYCESEGLCDSLPKGIVDSGWSGRWHDPLVTAIESSGHFRPLVFFVGQRASQRASKLVALRPRTFLFDQWSRLGFSATPINITRVTELVCLSDEGRTTGYSEQGGRVCPVVAHTEYGEFQAWAYPAISRAIDLYVEQSVPFLRHLTCPLDASRIAMMLITQFWNAPTYEEARAWKQYSYTVHHVGPEARQLADAYTLRHVVRTFVRGSPSIDPELWPGGAHQLSSWGIRKALNAARKGWRLWRDLSETIRRRFPLGRSFPEAGDERTRGNPLCRRSTDP